MRWRKNKKNKKITSLKYLIFNVLIDRINLSVKKISFRDNSFNANSKSLLQNLILSFWSMSFNTCSIRRRQVAISKAVPHAFNKDNSLVHKEPKFKKINLEGN